MTIRTLMRRQILDVVEGRTSATPAIEEAVDRLLDVVEYAADHAPCAADAPPRPLPCYAGDTDDVGACRGAFVDGYTPEDVDRILGLIADWSGLDLVVCWDCYDNHGPCGGSEIYCRVGEGLHEVPPPIDRFLSVYDDRADDTEVWIEDIRAGAPDIVPGALLREVPGIRIGRNLCDEDTR